MKGDVQIYLEMIENLIENHDLVDVTLETGEYFNEDDIRKLLQKQVLIDGLPDIFKVILKSRYPKNLENSRFSGRERILIPVK